jgi:hypothetical protein
MVAIVVFQDGAAITVKKNQPRVKVLGVVELVAGYPAVERNVQKGLAIKGHLKVKKRVVLAQLDYGRQRHHRRSEPRKQIKHRQQNTACFLPTAHTRLLPIAAIHEKIASQKK